MLNKIKEALQQGYPNLGLSEKAFEGVAAFVQTYIKDEADIAGFVKGEVVENLLKTFQSESDRIRGSYAREQRKNPETKASTETQPTISTDQQPTAQSLNLEEIITRAVAAATSSNNEIIAGLQRQLEDFKHEQAAKEAFAAAKQRFDTNGWVGKYSEQAEIAWDRAVEKNDLTGKNMNGEDIYKTAMDYFGSMVRKKGADVSKPFDSSESVDSKPGFDRLVARLQAAGKLPATESNV
jgi:hypothetical protein